MHRHQLIAALLSVDHMITMGPIVANVFLLSVVINLVLIWCAHTDIENLLKKEESTVYLPFSVVTLHCPETTRHASFRWTLKGRNLESYVKINESNGAIEVEVTPDFSGLFICYATQEIDGQDMTEISSSSIDIARIGNWKPVGEIPLHEVDRGDPITLLCENKPDSVPAGQYSWYKQDEIGAEVKESHRVAISRNGTLYFVYTKMGDSLKGDEYKCSVSNRMLGLIRLGSPKKFYVRESEVEDQRPSRLYNGTDDYTLIGRSAMLECIFSGFPAPEIKWFDKESKLIKPNEKYKIEKWGRMLIIENVDEDDEGFYRCIGENNIVKTEATVYLNVSSKPIFLNSHNETIRIVNDIMTVRCTTKSAVGESPPDPPVWLENGEHLSQDKLDSGKYEMRFGGMELVVHNLTQPDDYRCFQCIVSNSVGINYRSSCYTAFNEKQTISPKSTQNEIIGPLPNIAQSSDGVSQVNVWLIIGIIVGVMVLCVIVGVLALVVFRKRQKRKHTVPKQTFYKEVNQNEYGASNNKG